MVQNTCISCRKPKASLSCEICEEPVCRDCVQFLEAGSFSFMKEVPEELSHTHYCAICFDLKAAPLQEAYLATMEKARAVYVFFTTQRKAIPLIRKSKETVKVDECPDRDETILRLAFFAAEQDYNAIIDVDVTSEKVRNHAYHTSKWKGHGVPALVDGAKVDSY